MESSLGARARQPHLHRDPLADAQRSMQSVGERIHYLLKPLFPRNTEALLNIQLSVSRLAAVGQDPLQWVHVGDGVAEASPAISPHEPSFGSLHSPRIFFTKKLMGGQLDNSYVQPARTLLTCQK